MTDFKFHANDKFLNGQKLAWICISFTRDPRKRASFCKENSTAICYRICTVRCKRFAQVKNPSFQKFVRNRLNGVFEVLDPNRSSLSSPCKRTQLCWMLWICCILFSLRSARRISGRRLNASGASQATYCSVLLGIVAQSFKPVKLSATCSNCQHCWANNVGSCCVRLHIGEGWTRK